MSSLLQSRFPHLRLDPHELHLWTLHPQLFDSSEYESILSPAELDRASRFKFQHLRDSFLADHLRLRLLLGHYTEMDPAAIRYTENSFGKPSLAHPQNNLNFNLTHTNGLAMVALCLETTVGVDVEVIRPMEDWKEIAQSHFSAREYSQLISAAASDSLNLFFRCWTRKESFIKALGTGFSLPLDSFSVSFLPYEAPALTQYDLSPRETADWSIYHLDPAPGFIAACSIRGNGWSIRHCCWPAS